MGLAFIEILTFIGVLIEEKAFIETVFEIVEIDIAEAGDVGITPV